MYMEQTLHIEIKLLYELVVIDFKAKQHHYWSYSYTITTEYSNYNHQTIKGLEVRTSRIAQSVHIWS